MANRQRGNGVRDRRSPEGAMVNRQRGNGVRDRRSPEGAMVNRQRGNGVRDRRSPEGAMVNRQRGNGVRDRRSPEGAALNSPGWSAAEPRVVAASRNKPCRGGRTDSERWFGFSLGVPATWHLASTRHDEFSEERSAAVSPLRGLRDGLRNAYPRGSRPWLGSAAASRLVFRRRLSPGLDERSRRNVWIVAKPGVQTCASA
jgi:hypothetical protein